MLANVRSPPRDYRHGKVGVGLDFFAYVLQVLLSIAEESKRDISAVELRRVTDIPVARYVQVFLVARCRRAGQVSENHILDLHFISQKD